MHLSTHNWMRAEPLETTLARIKKCGYESIEISGEPTQYNVNDTRKLLKQYGIRCWGSVTLTLAERNLAAKDAGQRARTVDYMKSVITMVSELDGEIITLVPATVGKITPDGTPEEEWQWLIEGVTECYNHGKKKGVRIDTDQGITGWGEGKNAAGSSGTYAGLVTLINQEFAPRLIGRDARDISVIWDSLYNGVRAHHATTRGHAMPDMARRGQTIAAISAIDIALWDIAGKSFGVPVWRLLGGRKALAMPAYASGGWADAKTIGDQLSGYVKQGGFKAVKMRVGAMDGSPHVSADRVIAARAALGPDIEIMVDSHGTFTVAEAKRFAHLVRDCNLAWFEEPVTADDKVGIAEVRASAMIPIAAGESEFTRFDFRDLITHRAVDILQPDLAICGGITEARRIDALASSFNLRLAPHLWAGAPAFFAGLHLAAASPSSYILEYSLGANPMLHDLIEEEITVTDGMIAIPDRPGLGITVREDLLATHKVHFG